MHDDDGSYKVLIRHYRRVTRTIECRWMFLLKLFIGLKRWIVDGNHFCLPTN